MTWTMEPPALAAMLDDVRLADPREACGILIGWDKCISEARACRNVHPEPLAFFEIDPQALVDAFRSARQGGPEVLGYYHSHPTGQPSPSATDSAMAHGDGMIWAIIAGREVRFWRDEPGGFRPLDIATVKD